MVHEHFEREIVIDAPVELVWAGVTEAEHLSAWFSDSASIDLRPGGEAIFTWNGHGSYRARIERVEPPHALSFRWVRRSGVEPSEDHSTLVEFSLSAVGERTRLRMVESGFPSLAWPASEKAEYFEENRQGWDTELDELRAYASTRVGGSTPR